MDLIYCRGGTKQHTDIVLDHGWLYGIRSDYTPYHDSIAFLDINFEAGKLAWPAHEQRAQELKPTLTMIPDWFAEYTFDELFAMHQRLSDAGLSTLWTPKQHGIIDQIPDSAVLGVSVPTPQYAGFLPRPAEAAGRRLHMLGGEPDAVRYLRDVVYRDAVTVSADMSSFVRMAFVGRYWCDDAETWIQTANDYSNDDLIAMSAQNIIRYMAKPHVKFNFRRMPLRRIFWSLHDVSVQQLELAI